MTDAELRLECLKIAMETFPDVDINEVTKGGETAKYHCRLAKYRTELAEQYFAFLKHAHIPSEIKLFWEREDWT